MRGLNNRRMAGATIVFIVLGARDANANGFAIRGQSAVGLGMSFAGEGTPSMGLSAMFWNPASVSQVRGFSTEVHATFIGFESKLTAQAGTTPSLLGLGESDNIGKPGIIPTAYLGYQLSSRWFAGLSINAPYGLATNADNWAGQQLALKAQAISIEATPVVGWKVNDTLSVAAGPRILWFRGKFSRALLASPTLPALPVELVAEDVGVGFVIGATITPTPSTELALGYRSQVDLKLHGDSQFSSSPVMSLIGLGAFNGTKDGIAGNLTLPDQAILGVRQRVTETLTLLGTVEWTQWSVLQTVPFTFTNGPAPGATAATLNFKYRDSRYIAGGAEYDGIPDTTLRAGIGYDVSPITNGARGTALPESDSWWLSAGLTYAVNSKINFDLGYLYITYTHAPINVVPGHPDFANLLGASLIAHADSHVHAASVGFRYHL